MTQQEITEKLQTIIAVYVEDKNTLENINGETNLLSDASQNCRAY